MATISRIGFGQVEPNHLSAQRTSQIYAQLPADNAIDVLENGQFVKYDYANGVCNFTGKGEWMMVFNEVKLYGEDYKESYKDFAMKKDDYTPGSSDITHDGVGPFKGQMVPRVIKINAGDLYTTNCVGNKGAKREAYAGIELAVGDIVAPNASGYLVKRDAEGADTTYTFQVVNVYTMADGQPAVKVMKLA